MAKETLYFTHDFGARNDPKLINLQIKHGMAGIGCYWCIVEMLYENGGELPLEYERISFVLRTDEIVIQSIINDFKLFIIQEETFTSKSVLERIEIRNNKSAKARESISKRWDKYERNTNVSKNDTIKESKVKESKVKEIVNVFDYSETKKNLTSENEKSWHEQLMMLSQFKTEKSLLSKLNEFLLLQSASGYFPHEISDTKRHFAHWLRLQKTDQQPERKSLEKRAVV